MFQPIVLYDRQHFVRMEPDLDVLLVVQELMSLHAMEVVVAVAVEVAEDVEAVDFLVSFALFFSHPCLACYFTFFFCKNSIVLEKKL